MLNIFQRKMYAKTFLHQMHFCTALLNIFPLENVQHQQNVMLCFALLCKNTFLHQIHFCTAFVFCCAKNTAASNTFLHCLCFLLCKKHSSIKYICNILLCWTFSFGKCSAYIFLWKMFSITFCWCWTFSFGKCDAEHFTKSNVMQPWYLSLRSKNTAFSGITCLSFL